MTENTQTATRVPPPDASDEGNLTLEDLKDFRVRLVDGLSLEQLAEEVNQTISALNFLERMTLPRAVYVGQILNAAKKRAGHGQWLKWFGTHIKGCSIRKAENYMALASGEAEGELTFKIAESANLPIYKALEASSRPKKRQGRKRSAETGDDYDEAGPDEVQRDLNRLRTAYEDANEEPRELFHDWLLDQYGLEVAPGTGADAICNAYDRANKDERENFSEWLKEEHEIVVVPLEDWEEFKSTEEELERLDTQS